MVCFHNRAESIFIIDAIPLFDSFCNESSLVTIDGAICIFLSGTPICNQLNFYLAMKEQDATFYFLKSLKLFLHSLPPLDIRACFLKRAGFSGRAGQTIFNFIIDRLNSSIPKTCASSCWCKCRRSGRSCSLLHMSFTRSRWSRDQILCG